MRVLISNDDGIYARGLACLVESLKGIGEIFVVAPDRERSATGHSITVHRPLRVRKLTIPGIDIQGWAVDGTPSDCVKLAVEDLLPQPPEIILSGINQGPNLGTDVLYSGTVSAAIEGFISGYASVAVSLASFSYRNFSCAGSFVNRFVTSLFEAGLPGQLLLNINIPAVDEPKGIEITRLGSRRYVNIFDKRTDPRGRIYYWMGGEPLESEENIDGTDVKAIENKYISITPLHLDLTDYRTMGDLGQKLLASFKQ